MALVKFTKMHGLGNDYVYFDCIDNPNLIAKPAIVAQAVAHRNFGVGGDGIVLILNHSDADYQMRMFNADGSESEMCGNAIRCVAKYLCDNAYVTKDNIKIATGAGVLSIDIHRNSCGQFSSATVDMGEPILQGLEIPTTIKKEKVVGELISLKDKRCYEITCISMGNPHAVIFTDEITDKQIFIDGKELEIHEKFPNKINVEFVKIINRHEVQMRVWERGTGETMACGTGASAVCVAACLNGLTDSKITVHLNGGDLEIEWNKENNHVYMTGSATTAFSGEIDI